MNVKQKIILIVGIVFFLILALVLNFTLQRDYFHEIGISGLIVLITIVLLDGTKVMSETLFFKFKKPMAKLLLGSFALVLLIISAYTTFSVRQWKSVQSFQNVEQQNQSMKDANNIIGEKKKRLQDQIESLDEQIKAKQDLIKDLKEYENALWLKRKYSKEIDAINQKKLPLIKDLNQLDSKLIPIDKKKISLQNALAISLNLPAMKLETVTNIVIALTVEAIIIFLCYSLSYVMKSEKIVTNNDVRVIAYNRGSNGNSTVNKFDNLRDFREQLNLTQIQLSELSGVPRSTISKIETGKGELNDDLKQKFIGIGKTISKN